MRREAKIGLGLAGAAALAWLLLARRGSASRPTPGGGVTSDPNAPEVTGAEFYSMMPKGTPPQRDQAIIDAMQEGDVAIEWSEVVSEDAQGNRLVVPVMRRALAVGPEDDRLIVSMTFDGAQRVADLIDARMLTSKVADMIYAQADHRLGVLAHPAWVTDGSMGSAERMREQSDLIRSKSEAMGGLVANEGKQWIVTARNWLPPAGTGVEKPAGQLGSRHNGANFGWHMQGATSKSPGGAPVIQSIGLAHDRGHVDYSQLVQLMAAFGDLNGEMMSLDEIVSDPALAHLISDEGPLPELRHPDLKGAIA